MNLMKRVLLVIGILISIFCTNITRAQTTIGQMLENMTTEQKIAQMLINGRIIERFDANR